MLSVSSLAFVMHANLAKVHGSLCCHSKAINKSCSHAQAFDLKRQSTTRLQFNAHQHQLLTTLVAEQLGHRCHILKLQLELIPAQLLALHLPTELVICRRARALLLQSEIDALLQRHNHTVCTKQSSSHVSLPDSTSMLSCHQEGQNERAEVFCLSVVIDDICCNDDLQGAPLSVDKSVDTPWVLLRMNVATQRACYVCQNCDATAAVSKLTC